MTETKVKSVLITIENIRVKEYDTQNVALECLEEVYNPTNKETSSKWKFKGYFPAVSNALEFAVMKDLLINKNVVEDLESYLKQIQLSRGLILKAIADKQK